MLEHIFILSLICHGIHVATREGSILEIVERLSYDDKGNPIGHLCNVISECTCCMPSFWSIAYFWHVGLLDRYTAGVFYIGFLMVLIVDITVMWFKPSFGEHFSKELYLTLLLYVLYICPSAPIVLWCIFGASGASYVVVKLTK